MDDAFVDDPFAPIEDVAKPAFDRGATVVFVPILPAPLPLPETIQHRRYGAPSQTWRYLDAAGKLLFAACRFDPPGGKKVVLPYTCCGADGWKWQAPPAPRPLYGLDRLAARLDAPVLLVEGEKAADAAAELFPDYVAIAWPGGATAVSKVDWRPLAGRRVAVWPDADDEGRKAAAHVVNALTSIGASIVVVDVPSGWPEKWDVADYGDASKPQPEGITPGMLRDMLAHAMAVPVATTPGATLRDSGALAPAGSPKACEVLSLDSARRHRGPVAKLDQPRTEARRERAGAAMGAHQPFTDARGRADLFVNSADLPDTAADLAHNLAQMPHLFDRGGPARLAIDRNRDGSVVEALTPIGVVNEAHAVVRPWMWVNRNGGMERRGVTLSERVANLYLDHRARWGLRPLDGITSAPLLDADGSVRVAQGYDPETRLWCEGVPAVAVPDVPSRDDAAAALLRLRWHFRTFAFADAARHPEPMVPVPVVDFSQAPGADESSFLCALLTAVCRPCLWLAPGLLLRAPEVSGAGTGKGLLVRAICAIAFGAKPAAMTAGSRPEEFEKRVGTALMEGGPALFIDNMNSTALKSDVLASAITERPAAVRVLGKSALVRLNPTVFIAVTGNGLTLSEDMVRRFLIVELDAGMEDPEARDFRADFLAETMAAREPLLHDVLTIWRWGRQAGDGLASGRAMGSFPMWARWCRDPLLALGCTDPALRGADAKANDPQRRHIAEVYTAWWNRHHDYPVRVADLHDEVRAILDPAKGTRQSVAAAVAKLEGTRAAGFVLTRTRTPGHWSPDLYTLRQTAASGGPDNHRDHRDHTDHRGETTEDRRFTDPYASPMPIEQDASQIGGKAGVDPYTPYDPYASRADADDGSAGADEVVL